MKTKTQIKKDKKNYITIALAVILILLAVGYASFTQTLQISGTANGQATWNVHFIDAQSGILDASNNIITGTVTSVAGTTGESTSITVDLTGDNKLLFPGDAKKVRAVIKNDSSVPVKLTGFSVTNPASVENSDIVFKYEDLTSLVSDATAGAADANEKEVIPVNGVCTYEFVIGWDEASTATEINGTYSITFNYMQSTDTSTLDKSHSHS